MRNELRKQAVDSYIQKRNARMQELTGDEDMGLTWETEMLMRAAFSEGFLLAYSQGFAAGMTEQEERVKDALGV